MGTGLPTKVMLGQTLLLMQITFLNNVRKVGRLVLSRTSCCYCDNNAHNLSFNSKIARAQHTPIQPLLVTVLKCRRL
jgi:hypothetical protein